MTRTHYQVQMQAEAEERRRKIAANLLAGLNYRDMAEALNIGIGTISGDVKMILKRLRVDQGRAFFLAQSGVFIRPHAVSLNR